MFERRGARAHGVAPALGTVRVDGNAFPESLRRVHGRLHLVVAEGFLSGDVGATAGRTVHLDVVGARVDLLPHGLGNLRDVENAPPNGFGGIGSSAIGWSHAL